MIASHPRAGGVATIHATAAIFAAACCSYSSRDDNFIRARFAWARWTAFELCPRASCHYRLEVEYELESRSVASF